MRSLILAFVFLTRLPMPALRDFRPEEQARCVVWFPLADGIHQGFAVVIATTAGAAFGAWTASMAAAAVPNSRLKRFAAAIDDGKILLMVDVPEHRVDEIHALLNRVHPEAADGGVEPNIPAFP